MFYLTKFHFPVCRLAIQRLEITKNDLRHRIAKEVVSAILEFLLLN